MSSLLNSADYNYWNDIWPPSQRGSLVVPARVGMNRQTGKIMVGFDHVLQSLVVLFQTRYHERILREWVGSFVPHLLGENITDQTITRFFWAIATAIDLFEPCYSIARVQIADAAGTPNSQLPAGVTTDDIRRGSLGFLMTGDYMPRGHLGDKTVESRRSALLRGRGGNVWEASAT